MGGGWLGLGSGRVGWCDVCVCCESGLSVLMAGPGICYCDRWTPAHLRCTQLHLINICFLTAICLWQIS